MFARKIAGFECTFSHNLDPNTSDSYVNLPLTSISKEMGENARRHWEQAFLFNDSVDREGYHHFWRVEYP